MLNNIYAILLFYSEKNSKRARDMHLLKKLKVTLKETTTETDALQTEIGEILQDIRIASIRNQVRFPYRVDFAMKG